jgi:hypothetical protein
MLWHMRRIKMMKNLWSTRHVLEEVFLWAGKWSFIFSFSLIFLSKHSTIDTWWWYRFFYSSFFFSTFFRVEIKIFGFFLFFSLKLKLKWKWEENFHFPSKLISHFEDENCIIFDTILNWILFFFSSSCKMHFQITLL